MPDAKFVGGGAPLDGPEIALDGEPRRIVGPALLEAFVLAELVWDVGRCLIDRRGNRPVAGSGSCPRAGTRYGIVRVTSASRSSYELC